MIENIKSIFMHEAGGLNVWGKIVVALVTFILAEILVKLAGFLANKIGTKSTDKLHGKDAKRVKSLASLIRSVFKIVILLTWLLSTLKMFGINTSAIITTAGIGGLAISFGARSLVEDVISGVFLIFEDSLAIGDYVTVAGKDGEVTDIALRTTTIRDFNGELHVIPNGEIRVVTNRNRNIQRALVKFPIAYDSSVDQAIEILKDVLPKAVDSDHAVIEPVAILEATDILPEGVIITALCKTIPGDQWRIERTIRLTGYDALTKAGIGVVHNNLDIRIEK